MYKFILCVMCSWALHVTQAVAQPEIWIDLTHELSADAVFWPTAEPFKMTTDFEGESEGGLLLLSLLIYHR